MQNFYFTYRLGHKNYGGWVRVISFDWKSAMKEYSELYGFDYLNFYEESLFFKPAYPRGELQII